MERNWVTFGETRKVPLLTALPSIPATIVRVSPQNCLGNKDDCEIFNKENFPDAVSWLVLSKEIKIACVGSLLLFIFFFLKGHIKTSAKEYFIKGERKGEFVFVVVFFACHFIMQLVQALLRWLVLKTVYGWLTSH